MSSSFHLKNWEYCISETCSHLNKEWKKASVPGTIYTDLLNDHLIPDPFMNDNEFNLHWISENDWIYRTKFHTPKSFDFKKPIDLVFECIDTIAEIYLNGHRIGNSENMFIIHSYKNINQYLKSDNELNTLKVYLKSNFNYAKEEERKYGPLPVANDPERVYIRKPQYSFGWDWGPAFPTSGISGDVYLFQRNNSTFIENVHFNTLKITKDYARVLVNIEIQSSSHQDNSFNYQIRIQLIPLNSNYNSDIFSDSFDISLNSTKSITKIKKEMDIYKYHLWWPNGEGNQDMYILKIDLIHREHNEITDSIEKRVGIRTIKLILNEGNNQTFKFRINDIFENIGSETPIRSHKLFVKGVNWIPCDSFITRIDYEKYKDIITLIKSSNMNMVRVWGGGYYEKDCFYDLCDEMGILVWQDFMFACGSYPEHSSFLKNVEKEVEFAIKRIRIHPSLAIWCGNNENEWLWYMDTRRSYKDMPGYIIFSKLIPNILKDLDPHRDYWESSPFGMDDDPNSYNSGNRHEWGVWSHWKDYNSIKNDKSFFVTEFGFQGAANKRILEKYISRKYRSTRSKVFDLHNKQIEGNARIYKFMANHLPVRYEWDDFIYLSQLNQSFALKTCLEHWIFNYPVTNGAIIWQINDCWPVISWSLIDYDLEPKMAYYFVKNVFRKDLIRIKEDRDKNEVSIIIFNQRDNEKEYYVSINIYEDNTGKQIYLQKLNLKVKGYEKQEFILGLKEIRNNVTMIITEYDEKYEKIINRDIYTNEKWKYKEIIKSDLKYKLSKEGDKEYIILKSDNPSYFIDIYHDDFRIKEKGFSILPSEIKKLEIERINDGSIDESKIKIFELNQYLYQYDN